jgi:hypothetical protein
LGPWTSSDPGSGVTVVVAIAASALGGDHPRVVVAAAGPMVVVVVVAVGPMVVVVED